MLFTQELLVSGHDLNEFRLSSSVVPSALHLPDATGFCTSQFHVLHDSLLFTDRSAKLFVSVHFLSVLSF